jgi:hypothetical protein
VIPWRCMLGLNISRRNMSALAQVFLIRAEYSQAIVVCGFNLPRATNFCWMQYKKSTVYERGPIQAR